MRLLKLARVCVAILMSVAALAAQQNAPLTNPDVVKMVKAGMAEAAIVNAIAASDTQFDLSATGLQSLNQAGVSSKVIRAMLAADAKKKNAAAPAQDTPTAQNSTADASSGTNPQGMMPPGMSPDMMAQMQNMPPEMRQRMEAAMAQRGGRRGHSASANADRPASSRPGVPVPLDSPLYTSFARLQSQARYRMVMIMQTSDPRMAQFLAQGTVNPPELTVQGDTRQYVMHYKMPATDQPGTVDDWEIRAVLQNGRAARLITSAAVPRLLKLSEEKAAHDLAELDRMAATAIARAAAEGPMGAIGAGMTAAGVALAHVEVPKMLKMQRDMFSWQCRDVPQSGGPGQQTPQLTDLHSIGDQSVDGKGAEGYEFYAYDNEKTQGAVHLFVAKDTGMPLRIEMGDPSAGGSIQMNYSELTSPVNIEIPACMTGK